MKFLPKAFATLLLIAMVQIAQAQYCGSAPYGPSGSTICTAGTNLTAEGFSPPSDSLPCVVQGVFYDQTVQVKVPSTVMYSGFNVALTSIKIDTLSNLPCGLCWSTENSNNTFSGGSQFCLRVRGTSYDNPGQYNCHIIVTGVAFGQTVTENASQAGLDYAIRVQTPAGTCVAVDTSSSYVGLTASGVGPAPSAAVTVAGPTTFCSGDSVTFTAAQAGAAYQWYMGGVAIAGATARSYAAKTAGSYTVDVVLNCEGVTSTAQVVAVNASPTPAITANYTAICSGRSDTLDAGAGYTSYAWSNALGSTEKVHPTQAGTYYVTVSNGTCTGVASIVLGTAAATPTPTITSSGSDTVCQGNGVVLQSSTATLYFWSNGDTTRSITARTTGNYTVSTNDGCGLAASAAVRVTVTPLPVAQVSPAGPVVHCGGLSQLLTASGGATYQWLSSGAAVSGQTSATYTATATGSYSCIVYQNGCSDTSNIVSVTISGASLNPAITASRSYVCSTGPAAADTLDAGAGYTTYIWSPGGATTRTIAVTSGTTYSVTVGNGTCNGTTSINISSVVTPVTPIVTVTGALNICGPGSVTLTSSAPANVWSDGETTASITTSTAGIYTVADTNICGIAISAPDTFVISAIPALTVGQDTSICSAAAPIGITATTNAPTLLWSDGTTTATDNISATGTYTVTATLNGCTATGSVSVTVNPTPAAAFSVSNDTLTATTSGTAYQWYLNGNTITGATSPAYIATLTGNYALQVSEGPCAAGSASTLVTVTGIADISRNITTLISPNPTNGEVTIIYALATGEDLDITLTDMTGRTVSYLYTGSQATGTYHVVADMSALSAGVYLVNFKTSQGLLAKKIIKE
jgi:hypothetical protein